MTGKEPGAAGESLHPYVGWSLNPETHAAWTVGDRSLLVNRWGFLGDETEVVKRRADRVVIGITGGSVATDVSIQGEETFKRVLSEDSQFAGKEIQIVRISLPGFKQPQQLMALNFFLAMGFEFDAVVNLDGYNEAALTTCENFEAGVALIYPRAWHQRMQNVVDPRDYAVAEKLLMYRGERQRLAQRMLESPLHWSAARNLIWQVRDNWVHSRILQLGLELKDRKLRSGRGFAADGPAIDDLTEDQLDAEVVTLWERSSRQLYHLCTANGIRYIHCLQPNQYLEGSKPLSEMESTRFHAPGQCMGQSVNRLYPKMIAAGADMRTDGIAFHDLTQIFSDIPETLYSDVFCHLNDHGNQMLAEAVATAVIESWREP